MAAVFVALLLTACSASTATGEFSGIRLDNPYPVPDIPLTDTDGTDYSLKNDREHPLTIVFFGYTNCADFCPLVMGSLSAGLNHLSEEDRERVNLVFVTTDPARDGEAELRDYLDGYGDGFVGLTGELEEIAALAASLKIYMSEGTELPSGGRDLAGHGTTTLAVGTDDEAVALWKQSTSALEFAEDIHILLTED